MRRGVALAASVFTCHDGRLLFTNNAVFRPRPPRRLSSFVIVALLLVAGVEANPGPAASINTSLNVGSLNARSAVRHTADQRVAGYCRRLRDESPS